MRGRIVGTGKVAAEHRITQGSPRMVMHAYRAFFAPTLISTVLTLAVSGTMFAQSAEQAGLGRKATIVHKVENANERMEMTVATSRILTLDVKIPQAQVNDPEILDLIPLSPTEIQVSAKNPGITEVNLWDENEQVYTIDVIVFADARELDMILSEEFPNASLTVKAIASGVLISGYVDKADDIDTILRIAEAYYPEENSVLTNIKVGGAHQVALHIKVMEVSRTKLRSLGFDWTQRSGANSVVSMAAGVADAITAAANEGGGMTFGIIDGANSFTAMLEAMRRDNLAKILAEPTLVTVSGRPAYFQSGGEIPVITAGTASSGPNTQYKKYGTEIDFVPIVLGNGKIRLEVRPKISEIDNSRSTGGADAFSVRTVDTGVELTAGQTLAIAGLIQSRTESRRVGIPWVSELPYLGMMFRRVVEERNEIELLILVTPELVGPMNPGDVPRLGPGLQTTSPTDWQLYVRGHIEVPVCCQSCGGTGCSQCDARAAIGRQVPAEPGMIGGSDGQFHGAETVLSSEQIDWSRTPGAPRAHRVDAPITSSPDTHNVADSGTPVLLTPQAASAPEALERAPAASDGVSPAEPDNRSSQSTPSITPERASSSQLPGFMGPIGYDVVK